MGTAIAQTIKGIVTKPAGALRQSNYKDGGMVASIRVQRTDGVLETIWAKEGSPIFLYRQNDPIEFLRNGSNYIFFNEPHTVSDTTQKTAQNTEGVHKSQAWREPEKQMKQSMLDYTKFQAKVYLHIFKEVSNDFHDMGLKDENIKDITTTIFIQTQRKFNF